MRAAARLIAGVTVGSFVVLFATACLGADPEQTCQKGRHGALAKYVACEQKVLAKATFYDTDFDKPNAAIAKCQTKFTALWAKLQAKAPGSTCAGNRFVDLGSTIVDNLTGLQWEKKTDDGTFRDKDNTYTWSADANYDPNGTVFKTFLRNLNAGSCFAGQCDWRLPTVTELDTILALPCATSPCVPSLFGPTASAFYWSSTPDDRVFAFVWQVRSGDGHLSLSRVTNAYAGALRAVRGGL